MRVIVVILCSFCYLLNGQDQLIRNSDISWIGESIFEYKFESTTGLNTEYNFQSIDGIPTHSSSSIIKIDLVGACNYSPFLYLEGKIIDRLLQGELKAFNVEDNKELSIDEIVYILWAFDNRLRKDPESETILIDISTSLERIEIHSYRIKQRWYYNHITRKIFSLPIQMILTIKRDKEVEEIFRIPLKNNFSNVEESYQNDLGIKWIKSTIDRIPLEGSFDDQKGKSSQVFNNLLWEYPMNGCLDVYRNEMSCNGLPISIDSLNLLRESRIDTLIMFDPITFEERYQEVEKKPLSKNDIVGAKIEQIWTFNEEELEFRSYLKSISPLILQEVGEGEIKEKVFVPIYTIQN